MCGGDSDADRFLGLHFKGKAYEVMYNGIMEKIKESYPELLEPFPEAA